YISIQSSGFLNYIPSASDTSYVTTYFPGTSDIQKAEPVQIRSGEIDVHAIPMMALARRVIRARIVDPRVTEAVGPAPAVTGGFMTAALRPLEDRPYTPSLKWRMPRPFDGMVEFPAGIAP